jgi:hypothetical protein
MMMPFAFSRIYYIKLQYSLAPSKKIRGFEGSVGKYMF